MKIIRKVKVEAITFGQGPYVRVQAQGPGPTENWSNADQLYFSVPADQAPAPGQAIEFLVEWEAPGS